MAGPDTALRDALGALLTNGRPARPVRTEIVESWRRVAERGVQPDQFDPAYDPELGDASRLARAAAPILDQLGDDLAGTETSLLLTDERGHVVDRRVSDRHLIARLDQICLAPGFFYDEATVGTNGIGSALAQGRPAFVRGGEHFVDSLMGMACAGAPVTDPGSGQVLGVVDVTVRAANVNSLMLPFAKRAAWEIEQQLVEGVSAIERVLHERFVAARRSAKGPLALVGEYLMMTNTAAAPIVDASDQVTLWEWATGMIASGRRSGDVMLPSGAVITGWEPVHDGGTLLGALVWLRSVASRDGSVKTQMPSDRSTLGWSSLTETERGIAGLVADGLTNREVAARLFLSRYTVDAHLRHIFTKLDIRSRVELARIVAEHGEIRLAAPPDYGDSTRSA